MMSYSSLWEIDRNWSGKEYSEYKNSHLFAIPAWDILMCKYIKPNERKLDYPRKYDGKIKYYETIYLIWTMPNFFSKKPNNNYKILNGRINHSTIQYDRVLWELSNSSVFNAKDKEFVADCIEKFVEMNFPDSEYKESEHIKARFYEVAKDIRELPKRCKYFVFKSTSCDDHVEWWFSGKRLRSWNKFVCEFTLIEDNQVIGFSDNLKMCKGGVE